MRRRAAPSVVASPLLVGAVTVLITIVAVFLAYNANEGLPFVPTYKLKADLPNGAKLVAGNAVKLGGHRVGQVTDVRTTTVEEHGTPVTVAQVELALDKSLEELPADTLVTVRPISALGLKYVEIDPGTSRQTLPAGSTIPLANARAPVELEDVLSTFDAETRVASRAALAGYGDAFAGRGESLNTTLAELRPLVVHLEPVMRTLADPRTRLDQLLRQIGRASAEVAPIARVQADLFTNLADTFAALSRNPRALQATIERSPPTLETAISSFRVQRPFLADFAALSRDLEPASAELRRALPPFNRALAAGIPVLAHTPRTNRLAAGTLGALDRLARRPGTLLALQDLDELIDVGEPLVRFVAPYETVCNYANYFFTPLGDHLSEEVPGGTIERIQLVTANPSQDDNLGSGDADRPADVPPGQDPKTAPGTPTRLATQYYGPAVDALGRADCQAGQTGYMRGPLAAGGRYGPNELGGAHVLIDPDTPGRAGGTYVSRKLGIDGLEDVP